MIVESKLLHSLYLDGRYLAIIELLGEISRRKGRKVACKQLKLSGLTKPQIWPIYCLSIVWPTLEPFMVLAEAFNINNLPYTPKHLPTHFAVGVDIYLVLYVIKKLKKSGLVLDYHLKITMAAYMDVIPSDVKTILLSYAKNPTYVYPALNQYN
jgi:hypothetical protein